MSTENENDSRNRLVREKYFSLRPKPLERWLWQQGVPQAADRVFWLHWEEGMRRGDWCSELSLKQVARECCVDTSTVTRAYQVLKGLELIRREDPGRDPQNPFQQAIAVTEVRVPRALLVTLSASPNRPQRRTAAAEAPGAAMGEGGNIIRSGAPMAPLAASPEAAAAPKLSRAESQALMRKLSDAERAQFFVASRDRRTSMTFDDTSRLSAEERGRVLELLAQISTERPNSPAPAPRPNASARAPEFAKSRRLSPLEAARVRKRVTEIVPATAGAEIFRQVLWSVEEGALRRFDPRLATNIALKKIREGAWTRPNRMPPNWLAGARAETCSAA